MTDILHKGHDVLQWHKALILGLSETTEQEVVDLGQQIFT